mmetsp:Transcript_12129/g.15878  ORF Transcript_12129/g.15878 Transcript_12129/m.15878 type:complete len:81 (+) Transcript_12129:168-410(+)
MMQLINQWASLSKCKKKYLEVPFVQRLFFNEHCNCIESFLRKDRAWSSRLSQKFHDIGLSVLQIEAFHPSFGALVVFAES